jgi:hypothetical protein
MSPNSGRYIEKMFDNSMLQSLSASGDLTRPSGGIPRGTSTKNLSGGAGETSKLQAGVSARGLVSGSAGTGGLAAEDLEALQRLSSTDLMHLFPDPPRITASGAAGPRPPMLRRQQYQQQQQQQQQQRQQQPQQQPQQKQSLQSIPGLIASEGAVAAQATTEDMARQQLFRDRHLSLPQSALQTMAGLGTGTLGTATLATGSRARANSAAVQPLEASPSRAAGATGPQLPHEALVKAALGEASTAELSALQQALIEAPRGILLAALERAYQEALERRMEDPRTVASGAASPPAGGSEQRGLGGLLRKVKGASASVREVPQVTLSRVLVEFGGPRSLPLNKEHVEELVVAVNSARARISFRPLAAAPTHQLSITPMQAQLDRKKRPQATFQLSLSLRAVLRFGCVLMLDVEGGLTHFVVIRASSERSVFGQELQLVQLLPDGNTGLRAPAPLLALKRALLEPASPHEGLRTEGVFRVAALEDEVQRLRILLNRHSYDELRNAEPHALAQLVKLYLRELPSPLLSDIPPAIFMAMSSEPDDTEVNQALNALREAPAALLDWLIDLLADAARLEHVNRMGCRALSVVIAPNLYASTTLNPTDSLIISQKVSNFIYRLIVRRVAFKATQQDSSHNSTVTSNPIPLPST